MGVWGDLGGWAWDATKALGKGTLRLFVRDGEHGLEWGPVSKGIGKGTAATARFARDQSVQASRTAVLKSLVRQVPDNIIAGEHLAEVEANFARYVAPYLSSTPADKIDPKRVDELVDGALKGKAIGESDLVEMLKSEAIRAKQLTEARWARSPALQLSFRELARLIYSNKTYPEFNQALEASHMRISEDMGGLVAKVYASLPETRVVSNPAGARLKKAAQYVMHTNMKVVEGDKVIYRVPTVKHTWGGVKSLFARGKERAGGWFARGKEKFADWRARRNQGGGPGDPGGPSPPSSAPPTPPRGPPTGPAGGSGAPRGPSRAPPSSSAPPIGPLGPSSPGGPRSSLAAYPVGAIPRAPKPRPVMRVNNPKVAAQLRGLARAQVPSRPNGILPLVRTTAMKRGKTAVAYVTPRGMASASVPQAGGFAKVKMPSGSIALPRQSKPLAMAARKNMIPVAKKPAGQAFVRQRLPGSAAPTRQRMAISRRRL